MDFKIIAQTQDKTTFKSLDLFTDTVVEIIYNINDIREPESIKSNYTKEFEIPATKENNKFFEGLLYNGFYPNSFSPNLKVKCELYQDDMITIAGYLQVTDVVKNQGDLDTYKIIIYGELSSLFNNITGMVLGDLDFSEFNHTWNYESVSSSWDNYIFSYSNHKPFRLGQGYVYPFEFRGQSYDDMYTEDFFPAMYVKTVWDRIFKMGGKTYTSNFITNDERFLRLILPYCKSHMYISEEEAAKREFHAHTNATQNVATFAATVASTSSNVIIDYQVEDLDIDNIFTSQQNYLSKHKQKITLASDLKLRFTYHANVTPSTPWKISGPNNTAEVLIRDLTTGLVVYSEVATFAHTVDNILGDYYVDVDLLVDYTDILQMNHTYHFEINGTIPTGTYASKFLNTVGQIVGGNMTLQVLANSTVYTKLQEKFLYEGDVIDMNQILDQEVSIVDFLTSINKMFNLFWVPDGETNFIIEPRDNLYSGDNVRIVDWTNMTDRNEEITISPLEELNKKEYWFHHTEDSDYYNTTYTDANTLIYGERRIKVINDFTTDIADINVIFSPSPLVQHKNSNRVCSTYVEYKDGFFVEYEPNIRISIYGGLKACDSWKFISESYLGGINELKYPYAGHYSDPYSPQYDINWGKCNEYYYNWTKTTPANLFNTYWKNTITDLVAPDSHLWRGTCHIRTLEMNLLNIFDTIQMDEVFYKINYISYNPLTEIADVELFKANSFGIKTNVQEVHTLPQTPKPNKYTFVKGYGEHELVFDRNRLDDRLNENVLFNVYTKFDSDNFVKASLLNPMNINSKQGLSFGVGKLEKRDIHNRVFEKDAFIEVNGPNNFVGRDSKFIKILGSDNKIFKDVQNSSIVGNNNTVKSGLRNVTIIGDNVTATKSNTSYINGVQISNGKVLSDVNFLNGGVNEVQNPFNSSVKGNFIQCGKDAVQNIGGISSINFISGGVDNTNSGL